MNYSVISQTEILLLIRRRKLLSTHVVHSHRDVYLESNSGDWSGAKTQMTLRKASRDSGNSGAHLESCLLWKDPDFHIHAIAACTHLYVQYRITLASFRGGGLEACWCLRGKRRADELGLTAEGCWSPGTWPSPRESRGN